MNTIATICNFRPDLLEIQVGLCRRFCTEDFTFVVGTQSEDARILEAIKAVGETTIHLDGGEIQAGYAQLLSLTPLGEILYIEEDLLPTASFKVTGPSAARIFGGHPARTMRRGRTWENQIPAHRALEPDQLPDHWPDHIRAMYEQPEGKLGCEIIDGHWLHLDKSSMRLHAWFMNAKDRLAWAVAKHYGIKWPAESFARHRREATPEQAARRKAARDAIENTDWAKCVHRGELIEDRLCKTCAGSVKIKVFQCNQFETCSIKKKVKAGHICHGCLKYKGPEDGE
jgi:hypothetical protein